MKNQIKKMKQELKSLAKEIREKKNLRSKENNGFVPALFELRIAFRHKHVAYCLARGRTLEQVDSGKHLNMDYVNWVLASMKEDSKEKLYVVVNDKLSPSQQAVQAGHAVAEFLKKHPHTQWDNGYLIYLKDKCGYQDNMRGPWQVLNSLTNSYAEFVEPDVGNKVTAYACFGPDVEKAMKQKVLL
jgi:hypothetical protein